MKPDLSDHRMRVNLMVLNIRGKDEWKVTARWFWAVSVRSRFLASGIDWKSCSSNTLWWVTINSPGPSWACQGSDRKANHPFSSQFASPFLSRTTAECSWLQPLATGVSWSYSKLWINVNHEGRNFRNPHECLYQPSTQMTITSSARTHGLVPPIVVCKPKYFDTYHYIPENCL